MTRKDGTGRTLKGKAEFSVPPVSWPASRKLISPDTTPPKSSKVYQDSLSRNVTSKIKAGAVVQRVENTELTSKNIEDDKNADFLKIYGLTAEFAGSWDKQLGDFEKTMKDVREYAPDFFIFVIGAASDANQEVPDFAGAASRQGKRVFIVSVDPGHRSSEEQSAKNIVVVRKKMHFPIDSDIHNYYSSKMIKVKNSSDAAKIAMRSWRMQSAVKLTMKYLENAGKKAVLVNAVGPANYNFFNFIYKDRTISPAFIGHHYDDDPMYSLNPTEKPYQFAKRLENQSDRKATFESFGLVDEDL